MCLGRSGKSFFTRDPACPLCPKVFPVAVFNVMPLTQTKWRIYDYKTEKTVAVNAHLRRLNVMGVHRKMVVSFLGK
jgi:hypothetical protein